MDRRELEIMLNDAFDRGIVTARAVEGVHPPVVTVGILDDLGRAGLVRRFDAPRTAARFETRIGDNHHHAVCDECGRIEDVDCAVGEAPCLIPEAPRGFAVHTAEVVYRGICADCSSH